MSRVRVRMSRLEPSVGPAATDPSSVAATAERRGPEDLAWLVGVLGGGDGATEGPTAARPGGSFVVIPNARRPRYLVPAGASKAAAASLTRYNALRPFGTRAARSAFGYLFGVGVGDTVFRDRVEPPDVASSDGSLAGYLGDALGADDLVLAAGIGAAGPNRKPVVQVLRRSGEVVGYAKVGWNRYTRRLVRTEGAILDAIGGADGPVVVPGLLHRGSWEGLEVAVVAPLPAGVRRYRPADGPPGAAVTRAVAAFGDLERMPLAATPFWAATERRLTEALASMPAGDANALTDGWERLCQRSADLDVDLGMWHGDWSPWNLARRDGRLYAIDWEHARDGVPVGFDVLHFAFQVAFLLERRPVGDAARLVLAGGPPVLDALGISRDTASVLGRLYLTELFLRAHDAIADGAGSNPRFYPGIVRALVEREGP